MNEPAVNSRSRDPACVPDGLIINFFNNSMEKPKKSNSIFIHKISNLMETKYDLKRLLRTGTLLALLFAWMLTGSFVANAQISPKASFDVDLTIEGSGVVTVSGYPNPINGPVANSTVGPFADGSYLTITATPAAGWTFIGWTVGAVLDGMDVTPNHILVNGANVPLTATFKRMLTLSAFTADDKPYDGNTNATVTVWGSLVGVQVGDNVTLNTGAYVANFDNKNVGTGKTVTITGLTLGGPDAGDYALVDPVVTTASITAAALTVNGGTAQNKVFDGNTTATVDWTGATLTGVIAPDVVNLVTTGYTANFDNKNVGVGKNVNVAGLTLSGADAGNYTLTQPVLNADITPLAITVTATVADKVFDGTTTATVTGWTAVGTIAGNPTNLNTAGYVANFVDPLVGNGKTVVVSANVTPTNTNYTIVLPFNLTGNIVAPYYAMFTPTYAITRPSVPLTGVPTTTALSIEFNKTVYDLHGQELPINDIGDFVKLEKWGGGGFILEPFTSTRVGNKINIVPNSTLDFNTLYRIRYLNIYRSTADGGGQVDYTLDGEARNPQLLNALQLDLNRDVQFVTWTLAESTYPTVTPYGAGKGVCDAIKLTFVNPVKYLNGNPITDNPKHKFTLQSSNDGGVTWVDVPVADWTVSMDNNTGDPKVFTFNYVPGPLGLNMQYRIKNNVGLDINYGFIDKVTGLNVLGGEFNYNHTQGNDGWHWETVSTYPIVVDVAPWPISPVFPAVPLPSNATFDATPVVTVGPAPTYTLTKSTNFTANVTLPNHAFAATAGEGYHFLGWKRSTNGGASYGTLLPLTNAGIVTPKLGINYAPAAFNVPASDIKPVTCAESIAYQANFAINTYTVTTTAVPVAGGTVSGGGTFNHGATVTLTAVPAAGKYFVGWDYSALPASVQAAITANLVPDHTAVGYPGTGKNGVLTFSLVGPLVHGSTWNVKANFADFNPMVYAATEPQDAFSGIVNVTVEFGGAPTLGAGTEGAPFQGITYKWEQYVYNTNIKLEALNADCRYVFVKWQKWNPAILPAGAWVDFQTTNPTTFFATNENIRVKAVYKLKDDVHVSATAKNPSLATVIIFTDATRTTPLTINDITGADFTWGQTVYITSYPEPDYFTWRWEDGAGNPVVMGGPVRFEDRSEWTYTVGCSNIDLKAFVDLKEYSVVVRSLNRTQGTINASTPAFNASLGNQGGLGFKFVDDGAGRKGSGFFQRNSSVTFAATAATNWAFDYWKTPGGVTVSTANPYIVPALSGDMELIAVFKSTLPPPPKYALTVTNAPVDGGSVNLPSGDYVVGPLSATATAAPGYTFDKWTATGITLTPAQTTANPINFNMPANAVTLTANYVKTQYTVTPVSRTYLRPHTAFTIVDWGGTVSRTPATGTFTFGQTVQLTATPNPGFRFVNWMEGEILPGEILRGVQLSDNPSFTYTVTAVPGNPVRHVYAIFTEVGFPEYPVYNLTTAANPAGYGIVSGAGKFAHSIEVLVDEQVTEPGYEFAFWSPNVVTPIDYVVMDGPQHVVANYEKITYQLHVESAQPAYGGVAPALTNFVFDDLPIPVSAIPSLGNCQYSYEFAGWFTDAALTTPLLDAGNNPITDEHFNFIPYALPFPQTDIFIYAKFVQIENEYDITATVSPAAAGTATITPVGPYHCGDDLLFTTTPNPGYQFQHWTKDGVLFIDQPTFNWTVDDDADFVAVYEAIPYNVTATAQPGGTVAPAAQVKTIGQLVDVTATANTGYAFDGWIATGVTLANAMANPASFFQPANDVQLVAKFKKIDYNVTATANAGGSVAPAAQVRNYGDAVTVTATPNAGYSFNGWTATGVTLADVNANPASFTMPANDVSLVADFAKIPYTVTASVLPTNGGTLTSLAPNYFVGDAVSITATAKPGFEFVNWTAVGVVLANPAAATQNFTMPAGNVTLVANFAPVGNKLMGHVKYFNQFESGLPLSAGIKVALLDDANNPVGAPVNVGMDGYYEFSNITPGLTYKVKVWEAGATLANTWSWNNWGGVSAADALIISYMAANNNAVNNFPWVAPVSAPNYTPFAVEVADVDNNGNYTANDALIVMRRSIGLPGYAPFPIGGAPNFQVAGGEVAALGDKVYPQAPSVVFVPTGVYAAGTAGGDFYYLGTITGKSGETKMNIYFIAGGDVNASYVPQGGAKAQPYLGYNNIISAPVGEIVNIPVAIDQNVEYSALNMSLTFNNRQIEVLGVNGYDHVNIDNANGIVNLAWFDANRSKASAEPVAVITARILSDISATDRVFELNGLNEISDANAQVIEGVSFTASALSTEASGLNQVAELSAVNYPNPFNNQTTISYALPEAGKVNLVVYNKLGQVVKVLVDEFKSAGQQTVTLSSSDLNGSGTYLYKLLVEGSAKSYTVNGTLILVK